MKNTKNKKKNLNEFYDDYFNADNVFKDAVSHEDNSLDAAEQLKELREQQKKEEEKQQKLKIKLM